MSDTDIYKNREPIAQPPKKSRRKRSSSSYHLFDDEPVRKRRSKNTGLRRLLHLSRKGENEKFFWWGLLVCIVFLLAITAIWQYYVTEKIARERAKENEAIIPVKHLEPTRSAAE
jgi:hypothetical protein